MHKLSALACLRLGRGQGAGLQIPEGDLSFECWAMRCRSWKSRGEDRFPEMPRECRGEEGFQGKLRGEWRAIQCAIVARVGHRPGSGAGSDGAGFGTVGLGSVRPSSAVLGRQDQARRPASLPASRRPEAKAVKCACFGRMGRLGVVVLASVSIGSAGVEAWSPCKIRAGTPHSVVDVMTCWLVEPSSDPPWLCCGRPRIHPFPQTKNEQHNLERIAVFLLAIYITFCLSFIPAGIANFVVKDSA